MDDAYPLVAFRFDVQLVVPNGQEFGLTSPLCDAAFAECDGLEMTMELKTLRAGGANLAQHHFAGPVTYANLTLKRGMSSNLDLWTWFRVAATGARRTVKARGTVLKMKAAGLNAREGGVAIEEMQIAYESFEIESAGPAPRTS
jgi:phage tail-like protein